MIALPLVKEVIATDDASVAFKDIDASIDGETLTKSLGIIAAGVKLIDVSCTDPVTGDLVSVPAMDNCTVQSRDRCFPLEAILAKDKTEVCETFTDFFQFMGDLATDMSPEDSDQPINKMHPDLRPFALSLTLDLVGHHECLKKGGAVLKLIFSHML